MRDILPNRRPNETLTLWFSGAEYTLTVGFNHKGEPAEIFANDRRYGSMMQTFMGDACIIVSILLQHGLKPSELLKSLHFIPSLTESDKMEPASPIGAIIACVAGINSV